MLQIIAGSLKRKKLHTPAGLLTRPTSSRLREALFNICQLEIEGARFLDLFAGSGAMGIEALSRGAESAIFVDNEKMCVQCIRKNIKELGLGDKAQVHHGDAAVLLPGLGSYDLIYVDPPYTEKNASFSFSTQLLEAIDGSSTLLKGGMLFIEDSHDWDPEMTPLTSLKLKSSRKFGRSMLHQFVHREN
jgi:16S rRNA (guanine966-N2)-methyltransferase